MATYKFTGNNTYFNNICSSKLTFASNNGPGTTPIDCFENTCISPQTSGITPSSCRLAMLPSGQTNKNFEWGVEGDPWVLEVDYSKHYGTTSNYEFIDPTPIEVIPPISETGCLYKITVSNGRTFIVPNRDITYGGFRAAYYSPRGYAAMSSQPLNGYTIDPASNIDASYYEPIKDLFSGECFLSAEKYEEPIITYYNVGSTGVPEDHDVVLNNIILPLSGTLEYIVPRKQTNQFPALTGKLPASPYGTYTYYPPNDSGIAAFNIASAAYFKNKFAGTCEGAGYDPVADPPTYPNSWYAARYTPSISNVKPFHPVLDSDGVNNIVHNRGSFHTGYRMQKYVQVKHGARLGTAGANVSFGARDLETRMYSYGYTPTIEWKSFSPKWIILSFLAGGFGSAVYNTSVWCDVTCTIRYQPSAKPSGWTGYEYGSRPASGDPPIKYLPYPPYTSNGPLYGGPEWHGPHPNGAYHWMQNAARPAAGWPSTISHSTGAPPTLKSNPLSLQNTSKISYYTLPLKISSGNAQFQARQYYSPPIDLNYVAYQGQNFDQIVIRPSSPIASGKIPSSPNNMKIWRRKIT